MTDEGKQFDWHEWIKEFPELDRMWHTLPEPAKTLFKIQINNFAKEQAALSTIQPVSGLSNDAIFELKKIALADDTMASKEGAAIEYRDIVRKILDGQPVSGGVELPQPKDVDKWLEENYKDKRLNDEFGWTGEYRLCQKDLIDFVIDCQRPLTNTTNHE